MQVKEVAEKLGLKILSAGAEQQVTGGYVSDLLSDVIANAEEGCLWITVQRHLNIVAVAQLKKLAGIIISSGIEPEAAGAGKGQAGGDLRAFRRPDSFNTAGRLYALVIRK